MFASRCPVAGILPVTCGAGVPTRERDVENVECDCMRFSPFSSRIAAPYP